MTESEQGVNVSLVKGRGEAGTMVEATEVYVAAGRSPDLSTCGLDALGLSLELPLEPQAYATPLPWLFVAGSASGRRVSFEAATRGNRQMFPVPTAIPSMASIIPSLEPKRAPAMSYSFSASAIRAKAVAARLM